MANDEEQEKGGFVVKDRRRFDSQGNEKSDEERERVTSQKEEPILEKNAGKDSLETSQKSEVESQARSLSESDSGHFPEITFSSFVMSLATQTLMQLGEIKPPQGMEIDIDLVGAKQTISIIEMLEQKTKAGLDDQERGLLEEILHNLRLSFVRKSAE